MKLSHYTDVTNLSLDAPYFYSINFFFFKVKTLQCTLADTQKH